MKLFSDYYSKRVFLFFASIFVLFLGLYTFFHPAIITTPDDWYYITYTRDAIPLWEKNNPTRVLPEILMPLVSNISSLLLMPLGVGFEMSIACGAALVLACMITLYAGLFFILLRKLVAIEESSALLLVSFFLLFHFLIFRLHNAENPYLLGAFCLTNYYYYTIPILLNASMVMFCINSNILQRLSALSYWKLGVFVAAVYFCLVSNLYANIILATYFFLVLVEDLYLRKFDFKACLKDNRFITGALLFFAVILLFEANGGNAEELTEDEDFFSNLHHTLGYYSSLWGKSNLWFRVLVGVFSFLSLYFMIRNRRKTTDTRQRQLSLLFLIIGSFIIVNTFSILISARSRPYYVTQSDKMLMQFFWLIMGVTLSMAYCVKCLPKLLTIYPLLLLILFCHTNTKNKTFEDVMWYDSMPRQNAILLDIVKKVEIEGLDSFTLYVPKMDDTVVNWPYPLDFGQNLAKTFYSHRLCSKFLQIDIVPIEGLQYIAASVEGFSPKLEQQTTETDCSQISQP